MREAQDLQELGWGYASASQRNWAAVGVGTVLLLGWGWCCCWGGDGAAVGVGMVLHELLWQDSLPSVLKCVQQFWKRQVSFRCQVLDTPLEPTPKPKSITLLLRRSGTAMLGTSCLFL